MSSTPYRGGPTICANDDCDARVRSAVAFLNVDEDDEDGPICYSCSLDEQR